MKKIFIVVICLCSLNVFADRRREGDVGNLNIPSIIKGQTKFTVCILSSKVGEPSILEWVKCGPFPQAKNDLIEQKITNNYTIVMAIADFRNAGSWSLATSFVYRDSVSYMFIK